MRAMASQIANLKIVYSAVYLGADQRKYQRSASLAFVRGIHQSPVNSLHKKPVTRKMFPFDDVIMENRELTWWQFSFVVANDNVGVMIWRPPMLRRQNWHHGSSLVSLSGSGEKYDVIKWKIFALLFPCAGNPPVTDKFPSQRYSNAKLWCFFYVNPNKLLCKHSNGGLSAAPWHSCDVSVINIKCPTGSDGNFLDLRYYGWNRDQDTSFFYIQLTISTKRTTERKLALWSMTLNIFIRRYMPPGKFGGDMWQTPCAHSR